VSLRSIREELGALQARGLRRRMRPIDGPQAADIVVDGRQAVNFSSNNYLGLADHPALRQAAATAMRSHGFGAGASRLIVGNLEPHRQLEEHVARWLGAEAALLFNSGYHANVGIVSALVGPADGVYSDALNHASLIDGARLSRARIHVIPHGDVDALGRALAAGAAFRRRLVVVDSVFSMEGDRAPLGAIVDLARRYEALTLVDEAHAIGVLGPGGSGLAQGLPVDLRMATFGKALGGFGAFVAGSAELVEYLVHRARSFVFTTALPVPVVAWARAAAELCAGAEGDTLRARLERNCSRFAAGLAALGMPAQGTHIVPLLVGDPQRAMALTDALLQRGIFAQGVRPPTVPEGTSRLRFALMATHEERHLDAALAALAEHRAYLTDDAASARGAGP